MACGITELKVHWRTGTLQNPFDEEEASGPESQPWTTVTPLWKSGNCWSCWKARPHLCPRKEKNGCLAPWLSTLSSEWLPRDLSANDTKENPKPPQMPWSLLPEPSASSIPEWVCLPASKVKGGTPEGDWSGPRQPVTKSSHPAHWVPKLETILWPFLWLHLKKVRNVPQSYWPAIKLSSVNFSFYNITCQSLLALRKANSIKCFTYSIEQYTPFHLSEIHIFFKLA